MAKQGGVLVRTGHTEAGVDLAHLAGHKPAAVICEIMKDDGTMARVPDLFEFSEKYGIKMITIKDLITYRRRLEKLVVRSAKAKLPTKYGEFDIYGYENKMTGEHHVALVMGDIHHGEPVLCRVHSECMTGDIFGSFRCDCGEQRDFALSAIAKEGRGVFLYMRQEGRGIGLINKLKAYEIQEQGFDTVEANERLGFPADLREYGIGAEILADLGVKELRLMTNNPKKMVGLESYGITIKERVKIPVHARPENQFYLETKQEKMDHILNLERR